MENPSPSPLPTHIAQVVEAGLGHLPFYERTVITPTGHQYVGVDFAKKLCGVSIIRRWGGARGWGCVHGDEVEAVVLKERACGAKVSTPAASLLCTWMCYTRA